MKARTDDAPIFRRQFSAELAAGLLLFIATAAVVVWQNAHLAVLWDLSYTLENSYRISLGQIPYRDFPFVHAPLTFLIQAAIIKIGGRVFWHHTLYCALAGGLGTVLTWRILRNVLRPIDYSRALAFILSVPLVPLGIYSVFPHPFYDPDCTLAILMSVLLLQRVDRRSLAKLPAVLAGASLVIPLFVKQNTGLAFLLSAMALLLGLIIWERIQRRPVQPYILMILSAAVVFIVVLLSIHFIAGLNNYWHWTIQFAAERRTPARAEMIAIYSDKMTFAWLAILGAGGLLLWFNRSRYIALTILSALLISAPFVWPVIYLMRDADPSERAERLINIWPVVLIGALIITVLTIKKRAATSRVLPFILLAAINGCFMSQQLWGSTYAIWPLFMILVAMSLAAFLPVLKRPAPGLAFTTATLIALSLSIAGAFYIRSHERLSYANLDEGTLKRSTLPALKGLATRGEWIPQFEELVRYAEQKIPRDEGILLLPGEDAFYYATGRRPQFPVLLFDRTVNPYPPEQILQMCRERNIKWVIVKQDMQDEDDGITKEEDEITNALDQDFEQVETLGNYDIYQRGKPESGDDDGDDDSP